MYRKLNRLNHGYVCYSHQPKYTFFVRVFKYYVMTQWNSLLLNSKGNALLQKATFHHLVTKFSAFYATRRLITAFTKHRHLSLSSTKLIQSLPSHPIFLHSILSSHLRPGLSNHHLLSRFRTKPLTMHLSSPPYMPHVLPISLSSIWLPE